MKDIRDDEFRVIGKPSPSSVGGGGKKMPTRLISILSLLLVLGIGLLVYFKWPKEMPEKPEDGLFEDLPEVIVKHDVQRPLGIVTEQSFTEKKDTVINDVILSIYIPHNATPELTLGVPNRNDNSIVLAAQAADIRKDNRKILGAFILKGEPLAWGLSKKGYCAIIDGKIKLNLFNNYKDELTMRKALCSRAGQCFVVVSESDESFHDFAQALVDLGVDNAIYLVGSHSSFGWYINDNGDKTLFAPDIHRGTYKNENYIVWKTTALK